MTIAAGFFCSDGILLASDSLYSGSGYAVGEGPKFWVITKDDVVVVFGGAGYEPWLMRTKMEIERKISKGGLSQINIVSRIDQVLEKVANKIPPEWAFGALVAIRNSEGLYLYESLGVSFLSPVRNHWQCVGTGQSLGLYFATLLFREGMSLHWAKVVAAHLVKECKVYSDGCGGPTRFVEIPTVGDVIETDKPVEIEKFEAHLAPLTDVFGIVLPGSDRTASDLSIAHRLQMLTEAINQARRLAVAVMNAADEPDTVQATGVTKPPNAAE